jgi:hypothetical protein
MLALHFISEGSFLHPLRILVIALAIAGVVFWRVALRVIAALLILLLVSGAVAFADGFLHGIG